MADVHGWNKDQRVLQLVSYLDETAMNVAQELGDGDLYNLYRRRSLQLLQFDPASRVSAFCSRFHGQSRRHHEDADTFADALSELCRVGYPQSPPKLRQELITEQKQKLQTLIEVCTDLSSLMAPSQIHRRTDIRRSSGGRVIPGGRGGTGGHVRCG